MLSRLSPQGLVCSDERCFFQLDALLNNVRQPFVKALRSIQLREKRRAPRGPLEWRVRLASPVMNN
jgi:hypothetical protein